MITIVCPNCKHVNQESDTLVNWNWPCKKCGKEFHWNKYDNLLISNGIKHFKAKAARHRRLAKNADAEVARLEELLRKLVLDI